MVSMRDSIACPHTSRVFLQLSIISKGSHFLWRHTTEGNTTARAVRAPWPPLPPCSVASSHDGNPATTLREEEGVVVATPVGDIFVFGDDTNVRRSRFSTGIFPQGCHWFARLCFA
jgi:hypothetical protein